jgi:hypothetical protein
MSSDGTMDAIGNNINGIISYVELLVSGGGDASKDAEDGILGDKFFLKTGGQCTDINTNEKVDRYIYIDNVPDGSIPFISSTMGGYKTSFKGIVPGIMTNISNIEPTKMFGAFMMGAEPNCMEVTREVIDENGNSSTSSHHMIRPDILSNNNDTMLFDSILEKKSKQPFTTMTNNGSGPHCMSKKHYITRRPNNSLYGPNRPYYPREQSSSFSPYFNERPYKYNIERAPLPEYVMPVAIVPDFKLCEKEVEEKEEDILYAPDITHKQDVTSVPQIKEINIINPNLKINDATNMRDYSQMPNDTFLKIYYSSLGLLGLYIFLKMMEKKNK